MRLTQTTGFVSWIRHVITNGESVDTGDNKNAITMVCNNTSIVFDNAVMDGDQSIVAKKLAMFFRAITGKEPAEIKLLDLTGQPIDISVKPNDSEIEVKYSVFIEA